MMPLELCCICLGVEDRVTELFKSDSKRFIENILTANGFHQILYEKFCVCYVCKALVEKTYKFIQKVLTAQQILNDIRKESSEITLENLNAINRNDLGLHTNLSQHVPVIDFCFTEDEKEDREEEFIKEENEIEMKMSEIESGLEENLYENKHEVKVENIDVVDLFNSINDDLEAVRIKPNPDVTIHTASRNDIADFELLKAEADDSKHSIPIITIDDSRSEDSSSAVPDEIIYNKIKINKSGKQKIIDPDYSNLCTRSGKNKKYKKSKNKRKTMGLHQPLEKEREKKVHIRSKDYKPSAFMLSLPAIAEKKRQTNTKRYVHSDDSDDSKRFKNGYQEDDYAYNPSSSNSSVNGSEDSMYDRYDDSGRCLKKPDDRNYPMPCDHCGAEIPEKRVHYHHYLFAHPKIEYPYTKKSQNFLCQFCGHVSHSKIQHQAHELTHGSERAHKCNKCTKKFKNRIQLRKHLYNTHSDVFLECDYCKKKFKVRSSLVLHIRTHTGEKPFKCHICGAGFAHKGNVGIHIRSRHQGLSQKPKKTEKKNKTKNVKIRKTRTYSSTDEEEPLMKMKKRKSKKSKEEQAEKNKLIK